MIEVFYAIIIGCFVTAVLAAGLALTIVFIGGLVAIGYLIIKELFGGKPR